MLHDLAAWEQADLVRTGELAATELLEHYLTRIAAENERLNAFYYIDAEAARAAARSVDDTVAAGTDPGPWAGVPIAIKELEDVATWPSEQGSLLFAGNVATADSTQVARLRTAGAVLVGKTTSPELGAVAFTRTKLHGVTRNPWHTDRTPGGSSGGSAAAVAAGLVPIASASDGGGSIRIPASYSGLFGLKPTFGRIPTGPETPSFTNTSVLGCEARTVRDSARWLDVVAGADGRSYLSLPAPGQAYEARLGTLDLTGLRAVWSPDLGYAVVDPEVAQVTEEAALALARVAGLELVDRSVTIRDPGAAWSVLGAADACRELGFAYPDRLDELTSVVRAGLEWAMQAHVRELGRAMEVRQALIEAVATVFDDVDILLTPATPNTAFAAEGPMPTEIAGRPVPPTMSAAFTIPFNLTGNAAASVPVGFDSAGLPVGLQIVCRRLEEDRVLELSHILERERPWPQLAGDPEPD
ncbi:MAG: amidase [Acidimicrobiia bacterium]|nr:amidase [Acidimicrobiia bacterium]